MYYPVARDTEWAALPASLPVSLRDFKFDAFSAVFKFCNAATDTASVNVHKHCSRFGTEYLLPVLLFGYDFDEIVQLARHRFEDIVHA